MVGQVAPVWGSQVLQNQGDACRLTGLGRTYGRGAAAAHALDGIDLAIRANEFFTLLGPSGCGKTTLLRLIKGFDQPTTGEIAIFGGRPGAAVGPPGRDLRGPRQPFCR